jgi:hypothetical protein
MWTKRRFADGIERKVQTRLTRIVAVVLLTAAMATARVGATTLPESIPDFSLDTSRPAVQTVQSGSWSSPATWQGGQVPTANHVVRILSNHVVTIDNTSAVAYTIAIDGTLAFAISVNTRLKVTNLQVMAGDMGMGTPGILEVGTAAAPVAATVTAEIIIANSPIGAGVADPLQFGTGLIVLGKMVVHGSVRTPTFVRLATEPRAGDTTLTLSGAVSGWRAGDRLVLPDTRHIKESEVVPGNDWINAVNQWEERTVQAVSADGRTLTLTSGLQFDHLGARDLNGVLDFLPHVGNLTRNVVVRSESATGTRGHTLMTHLANVDIRYALFKDLGRTTYLPLNTTTNHIGRYPLHMHHLSGPQPTPANGYQFTLVGNAVDGGSVETKFKWGIAVHGSHYGSIQDNVVYNYNGAAIATEDGSESFNVFDHNFVLRGMGEPNDSVSEARMAMGTEGVGFWFRGANNFVRNNVAANYQNPTTEAAYGYAYQLRYLGDIAVPNFKGAHDMGTATPGQFTIRDGNNMPILQFENNEAYGAMQGGFTLWWVSSIDPNPYADAQESLIKDLKLWNVYNKAVYMYPSQKVTFDGLKIRGSFSSDSRCCGNGVFFADYSSKAIVIRNSDIQGMEEGITAPEAGFGAEAQLTIENSYLRNDANLNVPTNGSVNGCWMDNKLVVARNTRFDAPPGSSLNSIAMIRDVASAPECLNKLDEMRVYAYNGNASDNFQVYHSSPSVLPRPPSSCTPVTRAGITGPTCPIAAQGPVVPTATLAVSPASISSGQSATLSWNATNATTVAINQGIGPVAASGTRSVSPTATTTYTITATSSAGSVTATATLAVTRTTPTITWGAPASIVYGTALTGTQLNATTTVPGSWAYSPAAGTVLPAGVGHQLSVTFTPTDIAAYTTATATAAITVLKATPLLTWETPADITAGTPLSASQLNATANVAGGFTYTPPIGTVLGVGAGQVLSTTFVPTSTANFNTASKTVPITVTGTPTAHNAARANSYDDVWQEGANGWVANARAILAGGTGQAGLVLWIGDSLTRDPALGAWAQRGVGKTAEDQAITDWMHAGLSPQGIDSLDGFALATPYFCSARSYTVGDSLGAWDFMGGSMPADTNPATARQKLEDCATYPGALNLHTMLAALPRAQFAIPEVNLEASNPGVFTDLERMVDLMIANRIVPIILTYTYRTDANFNLLVDQYNTALVQYAQAKKLPLIDLNKEMLARLPFAQWPGRFLADGVHYTQGTAQFPSTSDPYANGGDPATHSTGTALTYNGYGLKGWLGVQKMKEIKQLVVDGLTPPPAVTVPNVVGLTQTDARNAITSANLTIGAESTASSTSVPVGSIVSQTPAAGTSIAARGAVSLVASSGPPFTPPPGSTPYGGTAVTLPGIVQAENFDEGAAGVAYRDVTTGNSGGAYRATDVDIEGTGDTTGGYNVGWMDAGEWLVYSVAVPTAGTYRLELRVAANGPGGRLHVEFDGVDKTGPMTIPNTGGWQAWTTISAPVTLAAGPQRMRLSVDAVGASGIVGNLNYVGVIAMPIDTPPPGSTPYGGTAVTLPGIVQAENFDEGAAGVAYRDVTTGNSGGAYRATDVDIEGTGDTTGGYNVGWMDAGEWLVYSVAVPTAGTYRLELRVAANGPGGRLHVEFDGVDKTGPMTIPNTGGWQAWTTISAPVTLTTGPQRMRVSVDAASASGIVGNLNYVGVIATATMPNAVPTVSLTQPADGASFVAPATIALAASASDSDGTVARMDFYAGPTLLGSDATPPYAFTWTSVPAGSYALFAVATDNAGGTKQSATVAVTVTGAPKPPTDIVIYASDVAAAALHGGWSVAADPTSPNQVKLITPNNGVTQLDIPLAAPAQYFDVAFEPIAGTPYTVWIRLKALDNAKANDAVWLQFSGASVGGAPLYQIGTTSGLLVNLATDATATSLRNWGWKNGAYWLSQPATLVFAAGGTQTLRVQTREDGVQLDQIIISPVNYRSSSPGSQTDDTVIVPKPAP